MKKIARIITVVCILHTIPFGLAAQTIDPPPYYLNLMHNIK